MLLAHYRKSLRAVVGSAAAPTVTRSRYGLRERRS
jgi:hypothetical protein